MATWNCQACTLENQDAVSTCTACRSPRPVSMGEWVCAQSLWASGCAPRARTATAGPSGGVGCVMAHPVAPHCPILTNSGSILLLLHSSQIPKKKAGTAQAFRAPRPSCSGLQTHAHHCRCTCCVEGVQSCRAAYVPTLAKGRGPARLSSHLETHSCTDRAQGRRVVPTDHSRTLSASASAAAIPALLRDSRERKQALGKRRG